MRYINVNQSPCGYESGALPVVNNSVPLSSVDCIVFIDFPFTDPNRFFYFLCGWGQTLSNARDRLPRAFFLSIGRLYKFSNRSLCNLPIVIYPVMCYTIITVREAIRPRAKTVVAIRPSGAIRPPRPPSKAIRPSPCKKNKKSFEKPLTNSKLCDIIKTQ